MMALGDLIESALQRAGITKERVEKWVGKPCACKERQEKLNALGLWARRTLLRNTPPDQAREYLNDVGVMDNAEPHNR